MQTQQKVEQLTAEINRVKLQKVLITITVSGSSAIWSCQPSSSLDPSLDRDAYAPRSLWPPGMPCWKSTWPCRSCRQASASAACRSNAAPSRMAHFNTAPLIVRVGTRRER
jgi:hypothetical protein